MRPPSDLLTRESPRQIIFEDFKIDLPISGGWGYDFDTACNINKNDPTINQIMPFNGSEIEHIFVEKRIYEEMIIFRNLDEKYSGIHWNMLSQELIFQHEKPYDKLTFEVTGFSDEDWSELTTRFNEIEQNGKLELMRELDAYRESKIYRFKRNYYFEISSFYGN